MPADDQAIVLPWASVMVTIVLLNVAATWATPAMMFLRSLRRGRVVLAAGLAIEGILTWLGCGGTAEWDYLVTFFLPAIATAFPFRVRAFVCVRWPRTGRPRRWRR